MEHKTELILHLYPPESGEYISDIYSDAGDEYGESRIDRLSMIFDEHNFKLN